MLGGKLDPMRPPSQHLPPDWRMYATSQLMFHERWCDSRREDKKIQDDV
jgi:hypothetical protein